VASDHFEVALGVPLAEVELQVGDALRVFGVLGQRRRTEGPGGLADAFVAEGW